MSETSDEPLDRPAELETRPLSEPADDPRGAGRETVSDIEPSASDWSAEIEEVWKVELDGETDPRVSIRPPTVALDEADTRPATAAPIKRVRPPPPQTTRRRRVPVSYSGDPSIKPGDAELEIIEKLGAGGMGTVYRARQASLGREVAVKCHKPSEHLPDSYEQFESEATITALLDHPNIVPVHDMGVDQAGRVFYAMKLAAGKPWSALLGRREPGSVGAPTGGKRDLRDHLEILLKVCNALAFSHSRGIVHRDIKPDNVMVGEFGEVLLLDWGLAVALRPFDGSRSIHDISEVSVTCGTPVYMAPETALGHRDWIGTWTDVYLLGAVLYEVLYGVPPREADTALETLRVAGRNDWRFPETIPHGLLPYHEVMKPILMRALASEPQRRFEDAAEFGDTVRKALRHLDSVALATEARGQLDSVAQEEDRADAGKEQPRLTRQERYRTLARVIAALEQALSSWPDNADARRWLIDAHLLHARSSLTADDLMLADTHLRALQTIPGGGDLEPDQRELVERSWARLREGNEARERRLRVTRTLKMVAVVLLVALISGGTLATFLINAARDRATTERNHLSRLLIRTVGNDIDAELRGLFGPVSSALRASAEWARAGRIESDDPDQLAAILVPLLNQFPVVSALTRADSAGHDYLLLRSDRGWLTRTTVPGHVSKWHRHDADGRTVETWEEKLDYHPHSRPWYQGAISLRNAAGGDDSGVSEIHWTSPYTFFTNQEPGITASIPVTTAAGRRFVLGLDISLADISEFTMAMPDSQHGKVFVLSEDDRVIGLPRSPSYTTEKARKQAVLTALPQLGETVPTAALRVWNERDRAEEAPFRFVTGGQAWWAGFLPFELGPSQRLWTGVVLPESDFSVPRSE